MVPAKTVAAAMTSRMLLKSRKTRARRSSKPACDFNLGAATHRVSCAADHDHQEREMKTPRFGSARRNAPNQDSRAHQERPNRLSRTRAGPAAASAFKQTALVRHCERMIRALPTSHA